MYFIHLESFLCELQSFGYVYILFSEMALGGIQPVLKALKKKKKGAEQSNPVSMSSVIYLSVH